MTSEEAVQVVSELLAKNAEAGGGKEEEQANVAEQLIEAVLEKVVACVAPIRSWMLLDAGLIRPFYDI